MMTEQPFQDGVDRRAFLATATAAGLAAFVAPGLNAQPNRVRTGRTKNVIFMVSDGMSIGSFQLADRVHEMRHSGQRTNWVRLMQNEGSRTVFAMTHSANSEVTDSAAASSAWSIGQRCRNGAISVSPEGNTIEPIWIRAKRTGRGTALVTTSRVTHATPAAFVANVDRRSKEDQIAQQILDRKIDVVLGGGARHFSDEMLEAAPRVRVVRNAAELASANEDNSGRLLGIFKESHLSYELDRPETEPSLSEMTRAALKRMDQQFADGFVMQVEGARVDHAAHSCDAAGIVNDQLAFDEALGAVLEWMADRDDTLLIVTTDHGNASPNMTLYGDESIEGMSQLDRATASFSTLMSRIKPVLESASGTDLERLGEEIEKATSIRLTDDELGMITRAAGGETVNAFKALRGTHHVLGSVLANHTGISFVSGNHTAEHVIATAIGVGSEQLDSVGHLTDTHALLVDVLGLPEAREM
ncbi:MAG: alkaline phosphatase [Planctomycetota bacterium]